jgi:hypothetical protein
MRRRERGIEDGFDLVNGFVCKMLPWQGAMRFYLMVSKYLMESGARHSWPAGELMDVL